VKAGTAANVKRLTEARTVFAASATAFSAAFAKLSFDMPMDLDDLLRHDLSPKEYEPVKSLCCLSLCLNR
jgi:hypothetical protein